jgi:hypothetical protein
MATFFFARNNGVVALIRSDDAQVFRVISNGGGDPFNAGPSSVKVFTFCDAERLDKNPEERKIFTGSYELMQDLLAQGHVSKDSGRVSTGWSGFVPFSNQEHRMHPDGDWKKYLTTAEDVVYRFELLKR